MPISFLIAETGVAARRTHAPKTGSPGFRPLHASAQTVAHFSGWPFSSRLGARASRRTSSPPARSIAAISRGRSMGGGGDWRGACRAARGVGRRRRRAASSGLPPPAGASAVGAASAAGSSAAGAASARALRRPWLVGGAPERRRPRRSGSSGGSAAASAAGLGGGGSGVRSGLLRGGRRVRGGLGGGGLLGVELLGRLDAGGLAAPEVVQAREEDVAVPLGRVDATAAGARGLVGSGALDLRRQRRRLGRGADDDRPGSGRGLLAGRGDLGLGLLVEARRRPRLGAASAAGERCRSVGGSAAAPRRASPRRRAPRAEWPRRRAPRAARARPRRRAPPARLPAPGSGRPSTARARGRPARLLGVGGQLGARGVGDGSRSRQTARGVWAARITQGSRDRNPATRSP